jgi:hypothetical protein
VIFFRTKANAGFSLKNSPGITISIKIKSKRPGRQTFKGRTFNFAMRIFNKREMFFCQTECFSLEEIL